VWQPRVRRTDGRVFVCVVVLLAGCARSHPQPATSTLRWGGALTVTGGSRLGVNAIVDNFVGDALLGIDWTGRVQPRLADSWQWDADHLRLELKLHQGLRFHDGSAADARAIAGLLQNRIDSQEAASYADVTKIEATDGSTIVLQLKRPNAFLLADLAESTLRDRKNLARATGPFRIASLKPTVDLVAFDQYYRDRPQIDRLEIKPYDTLRGAWAAMMRGEIDVLQDVGRDTVEFVEAESSVQVYRFLRPYYYPLVFNVRNPVLKSKEVRQALSQAVDRQTIVERAMHGRGRVADGPIWPFHWAHSEAQRKYSYNPEVARLRLEAAGLKVNRDPQPGFMPSRLRFTCLLVENEQAFDSVALYLQKQFAEIGVDMQIQPVPLREFGKRLGTGDFDAFVMEMVSARSLTWTYTFWHSNSPYLHSGYDAADGPLDRLRVASSDDDTRSAVAELQQALYDDPPAIFIAWPEAARAVRGTFEVPPDSNPDVMGTLWRWKPVSTAMRASR
jgi:peptide/nickel transport system substrate-binding protein